MCRFSPGLRPCQRFCCATSASAAPRSVSCSRRRSRSTPPRPRPRSSTSSSPFWRLCWLWSCSTKRSASTACSASSASSPPRCASACPCCARCGGTLLRRSRRGKPIFTQKSSGRESGRSFYIGYSQKSTVPLITRRSYGSKTTLRYFSTSSGTPVQSECRSPFCLMRMS